MAVRIVRLGSRRQRGEGVRIGTVRRPPRGVPKAQYATRDWYDVWLPNLAPSAPLIQPTAIRNDVRAWKTFVRRYEAELKRPEQARVLDVLAALSHVAHFSVGCY